MSKAIGWTLVIMFVLMLGTHPSAFAGLIQHLWVILEHAGNEFSSFITKL